MQKTIAELEAASDAATAAYSAADARLAAVDTLLRKLSALEDIDHLTAEDESDLDSLRARSRARRPALVAECNRLEDLARTAAKALNDAPEEADPMAAIKARVSA